MVVLDLTISNVTGADLAIFWNSNPVGAGFGDNSFFAS